MIARLTRRAFAGLTLAAAAGGTVPVWARTDAALDAPLRELYAALETAMRTGRSTPFAHRFELLAPVVDQVFDLETVLKVSIGMRWQGMDADTQSSLLRAYRRFTVATYVANFDRYDGEHFIILPGARDSGGDRIVGTEIVAGNGQPMRVDYVMHDDNGTWRAVDVLLEGSISRVAVQRSDFRKILANGDVEALIASLRHKVASLSDGALSS
jgi:phospholipid transport system substrate-binding protein